MKKYLILIMLMSVCILNAQFNINDYVWIYDATNPPSLEQVNDEWQKPIWQFTSQDSTQYYISPFLDIIFSLDIHCINRSNLLNYA